MSTPTRLATLVLIAAAATLPSCSNAPVKKDYAVDGSAGLFTRGEFDEAKARDDAVDETGGSSFEDVGDTADCTEDCSGHEAGFEWAKDRGITDSSECGGDSASFEEGCEAYASAIEAQVEQKEDDFESGDGASDE